MPRYIVTNRYYLGELVASYVDLNLQAHVVPIDVVQGVVL